MIKEEIFLKIIRDAIKAPSGHNSQPWKFSYSNNKLKIKADYEKSLPIADPDSHELLISLGCALQNALLSAKYFGYRADYEIKKDYVEIDLYKCENEDYPEIYNYIKKRQTTTSAYSDKKIDTEIINKIIKFSKKTSVSLKHINNKKEINKLKPLIFEAIKKQFKNKNYLKELIDWIRFSENEAMIKGDGIWTASRGLPNMGRLFGSIIMKLFVSHKSEIKTWSKLIDNSDSFVLFTLENTEAENLIRLGQSLQLFNLKLTEAGIKNSYANMPCRIKSVSEKFISDFDLKNQKPILLLRLGYAESKPYSFRRNIKDFII
jgi:hypothetical protein